MAGTQAAAFIRDSSLFLLSNRASGCSVFFTSFSLELPTMHLPQHTQAAVHRNEWRKHLCESHQAVQILQTHLSHYQTLKPSSMFSNQHSLTLPASHFLLYRVLPLIVSPSSALLTNNAQTAGSKQNVQIYCLKCFYSRIRILF